jgi:hypothetical protein
MMNGNMIIAPEKFPPEPLFTHDKSDVITGGFGQISGRLDGRGCSLKCPAPSELEHQCIAVN